MNNEEEWKIKEELIQVGKRMEEANLIIGTGGNFSQKISKSEILITASGFCKSKLTSEQITKIDLNGNILSGLKPAKDFRMHLEVYRTLPEIKGIVHAHPPIMTGFSVSNFEFTNLPFSEIYVYLGQIEYADFSTTSTQEVADSVHAVLTRDPKSRAIILRGHGTLTISETSALDACYKLETMEAIGKSILVAQALGGFIPLTEEQIKKISASR